MSKLSMARGVPVHYLQEAMCSPWATHSGSEEYQCIIYKRQCAHYGHHIQVQRSTSALSTTWGVQKYGFEHKG